MQCFHNKKVLQFQRKHAIMSFIRRSLFYLPVRSAGIQGKLCWHSEKGMPKKSAESANCRVLTERQCNVKKRSLKFLALGISAVMMTEPSEPAVRPSRILLQQTAVLLSSHCIRTKHRSLVKTLKSWSRTAFMTV